MVRYLSGMEFGKPIPLHAQTEAALDGVAAVRAAGAASRYARAAGAIVTDHGVPKAYDGEVVTASALSMAALARGAGFEVEVGSSRIGCAVQGLHPARVGFTATWLRGKAQIALWRAPWRYEMIDDPRPVGVNALTRTGKAGYRPAGVAARRLSLVASPLGVRLSFAALRERIVSYHA